MKKDMILTRGNEVEVLTEKILCLGTSALTDAEIISLITGAEKLTATSIVEDAETLYNLGKLTYADLTKHRGIGERRAVQILAAIELGRRREAEEHKEVVKVTQARDAYNFMKSSFQDLSHEEFWVLGLTRSNRIIKKVRVSMGGRSGTVADGKVIFKELIDMKASACILFHNHPSGNLLPSPSDISLTRNMSNFGKLIDLPVLDHLIITDKGFYSFAEEGKL